MSTVVVASVGRPIFVASDGRRALYARWLGRITGVLAAAYVVVTVAGLVGAPWVPHLGLPGVGAVAANQTPGAPEQLGNAASRLRLSEFVRPAVPATGATAVAGAPALAGTPAVAAPISGSLEPGALRGSASQPAAAPPGHSADAPGHSASGAPGSSTGAAPSHATSASPGKSGAAPGHATSPGPGQSGAAPGHAGPATGDASEAPGHSSDAPGHSGAAPGHSGGSHKH